MSYKNRLSPLVLDLQPGAAIPVLMVPSAPARIWYWDLEDTVLHCLGPGMAF